jgi:ATP-dependent DNA helicase RecQ
MSSNKDFDETLYGLLKKTCKKMAKEMGTDVDAIIQDDILQEIATFIPTSLEDLKQVTGLNTELATHFLAIIKKYVADHHSNTPLEVPVTTKTCKATDKVYIVKQIDRKLPLEEIAAAKLITLEELLDDIEAIYCTGIKLNLGYYIDSILTPDEQQEIQHVFMQPPVNNLQKAYSMLGDTYAKEDIRLMHIKMLFDTKKQG